MAVPRPTPIYRIIHMDNLDTCLRRGFLCAPKHTPKDGLPYRTIHDAEIQSVRQERAIPCGPRGTLHDYVAFYFGFRSPMLYRLHTGWVSGYDEGQEPIIYLVSTVQAVVQASTPYVFSDGHGIANYTAWFDAPEKLDKVDWNMVYQRMWKDTNADPDRQRRKQAEFLVHLRCDWGLIHSIGVLNCETRDRVEAILGRFDPEMRRPVEVKPAWYY